jgi:hypothetical protein
MTGVRVRARLGWDLSDWNLNHREAARRASRRLDKHVQADLDRLWEALEAGDKGAVLSAINICFHSETAVPGWVQSEFTNACTNVRIGLFKSWDEVFGRPHKKGAQLGAVRRKRPLRIPILNRVEERHAAGEPISKDLFDSVGAELGIGGTLVSEIYSEAKKMHDEFMKERGRKIQDHERRGRKIRTSAKF